MTNENDAIPQVSLLAFEVEAERARLTIRNLLIGWSLSIAALAASVAFVLLA